MKDNDYLKKKEDLKLQYQLNKFNKKLRNSSSSGKIKHYGKPNLSILIEKSEEHKSKDSDKYSDKESEKRREQIISDFEKQG